MLSREFNTFKPSFPRLTSIASLVVSEWRTFSLASISIFEAIPFFRISSFYWPLPTLIFAYAFLLRHRHPATARNLGIGAAILCLSLTFRSIDMPLCPQVPLGTHWLWHCLNALMLGWMIETWRRHVTSTV